jgi:hypothetical protein
MNDDLLWFFLGIVGLILYLVISAKTEMMTKWPGSKESDDNE